MEEIYQMLPKGIFNDYKGFSEYVKNNGIDSVYEMIPEGIFNDKQGFIDYTLKKKNELQPTSQEDVTEFITKEEEPTTLLESSGEEFDYESFINKSEEEAVSELQSKLTGKGYTVEETGIGNALLVTDNITGEKTEIDLKPIQLFKGTRFEGDTDRNVEEINKVKSLIEKPVDDKRYLISQNKFDTYKNDRNAFIQSLTDKYPSFDIQYISDPNLGATLRISKDGNSQDFNVSKGRFNDADQFTSINKFIYDNLNDEEAKNISNQIKIDQLKRLEEDIRNIESDIDISMESAEADFFNENYFKGLFNALEKSGYQIPDEARKELESGKVLKERFSPIQKSMVPTLVNMDATDIQNGIEKYFGDNDEILDKIDTYNKSGAIQKRLEKINRAKKLATEVYYENLPDREGVKEVVRQLNKDAKDEEVEILTNVKLAEKDFLKIVNSINPQLQELSLKYPDVNFNYYINDKDEFKITSSEPVDEVNEIMDRVNGVAKTYASLLEKSRYDLEKINAKRETTDEFLEAGNRNYNIIDTAYADFKNAVTQLGGGVAVIKTLAEGAVEDVTGTPVSFGGIQTVIPSDIRMKMIREDMKESREDVDNFYETKRTYNEAIKEGSFGTFSARTFSEQAPNIILAVGTSGAGNAIGLSEAAISTLVATQFGVTSAGQKYDELTTRQEFGVIAEKGLEDLKKLKGIIPDDEYFSQKYELERAIEDSKISSFDKTLAVVGTGLVEGLVTRYIGTVPNSIKVLKDLKGPVNFMDDILRSNYSASKKALVELGKRTGGEIIEETSIDLLSQINDYAFLGDQIDLSSLDDVAITSIITSGGMNVPSTAYSTILTQTNVNRYKSKINAITEQINTLKGVLSDPDLTDIQRSYIHNTISNNIKGIAEQTTNIEADAMLLGADNIKEMITMSGVRNSMLKKAGVEADDTYDVANAKIDNYLKTLDKAEANKFIENMNFIDTRRNEILEKINYEGAVEKVFGDKGKDIAKDLDPSLTPQQKYVEVYKQIRQEINDNAKKEYDAIQEQEIPDEILNLKDDEVKVFTVENIEDIPEQFRDRAEKKEGTTVKVRRKILGLPIGKETEKTIGEGYSYTLTGKEIKDYAIQEQETRDIPDAERAEGVQEMEAEVREPAVQEAQEVTEQLSPEEKAETVSELINRPVTLTKLGGFDLDTPLEGDMYVDGQRIVVEDANGNITDIGNVDEISDKTLGEMGIEQQIPSVTTTDDGNIEFEGKIYNSESARIKRDSRGNITSVTLDQVGKPRSKTLRGKNAEDAAYNVLLRQAQQSTEIEQLLEQNEEFQNELRQAEATTKTETDTDTEQAVAEEKPKAGNRLFNEPLKAVKEIANRYHERVFGKERPKFEGTRKLDKEFAKRISDAFANMQNNPNDPDVKASYEAMAKETMDQYQDFIDAGYTVEINNEEPYANSQEMIDDLRKNKRIKIFSTESGFGDTPITDKQRNDNPLLRDSGVKDINGQNMLINDVFRAIHDFYGHAELGNSFGPKGEENAWQVHARMFSPLARRAMTTETRGQNSYVNFSGVNKKVDALREKARKLREQGKDAQKVVDEIYKLTRFADQKIGLLPEEFSNIDESDGIEKLRQIFGKRQFSDGTVNTLSDKLAIVKQANRAIKSLAKLFPDVKINVFYEERNYHQAIGVEDFSAGSYDGNNTININLTRATKTTVAHEVFHAILAKSLKSDKAIQNLTKKFVDSLLKTQDKRLIKLLQDAVGDIKQYENVQNEEVMSELFGVLAGYNKKLDKDTRSLVKRFFDRLAKLFGLKKFTDSELVDVLNTLARKVQAGQEITDLGFMEQGAVEGVLTDRKQAPGRPSISEVRKAARENGISEADTNAYLKELGYTDQEIASETSSAKSIEELVNEAAKEDGNKDTLLNRVNNFISGGRERFFGFVNKKISDAINEIEGIESKMAELSISSRETVRKYIKQRNKAIKVYAKKNNISNQDARSEIDRMVNNLMSPLDNNTTGKDAFDELNKVNKKLASIVMGMRSNMDSMSKLIMNDPSFKNIPESTRKKIAENLGNYIHETYLFFVDKKFKPTEAMKAEAYLVKANEILSKEPKLTTEEAVQKAKEYIDSLLSSWEESRSPNVIVKNLKISQASVKVDADALKARTKKPSDLDLWKTTMAEAKKKYPKYKSNDKRLLAFAVEAYEEAGGMFTPLPQYLKNLLGQVKEPSSRYINTMLAQGNLIYKNQAFKRLADTYMGEFIMTTKPTKKSQDFVQVDDRMSPLHNLWVHKSIIKEIESEPIYKTDHKLLEVYYKALNAVRRAKILPSSPTWIKNIVGGYSSQTMNGMFSAFTDPILSAQAAAGRTAMMTLNKRTEFTKEIWKEASKAGVLATGVEISTLGYIDDMYRHLETGDNNKAIRSAKMLWKKTKNGAKNLEKKTGQRYAQIDDYTKAVMVYKFKYDMALKMYGKEYNSLNELEKENVLRRTGNEVKTGTPTWSRLPSWFKNVARVPVGDFVSFRVEAIRSFFGAVGLAVSDARAAVSGVDSDGNVLNDIQKKAYAKTAGSRMIGIASNIAMHTVVNSFIHLIYKLIFGDDEDEIEMKEQVVKLRPEWTDDNIIVTKVKDDGTVVFFDYSGWNQYADVLSMMSGNTEPLTDSFDINMLVKYVKEAYDGEKDYGDRIWSEEDNGIVKIMKSLGHISYEGIMPSIPKSFAYQYSKRKKNNENWGSIGDVTSLAAGLSTIRTYEYNIYKNASSYVYKINSDGYSPQLGKGKSDNDVIYRLENLKKFRDKINVVHKHYGSTDNKGADENMSKLNRSIDYWKNFTDQERYLIYSDESEFNEAMKSIIDNIDEYISE